MSLRTLSIEQEATLRSQLETAASQRDGYNHRLHRLLFELQTYISRPSLEAAIQAARLPAAVASTPRAAEALYLLNLLMTPAERPGEPTP